MVPTESISTLIHLLINILYITTYDYYYYYAPASLLNLYLPTLLPGYAKGDVPSSLSLSLPYLLSLHPQFSCSPLCLIAACAAAIQAIGTRYGLQET